MNKADNSAGPSEGVYCKGINFQNDGFKYDFFNYSDKLACCEEVKASGKFNIIKEESWKYLGKGRWAWGNGDRPSIVRN